MKWIVLGAIATFVIFVAIGVSMWHRTPSLPHVGPSLAVSSTTSMPLKITSSAFEDQKPIPSEYTCDGKGLNPPLSITGVPKEAQSLVLLLEDPDAPVGIFDHWVTFNIPASDFELSEGLEPSGTHGKGTTGNLTYMGPCPPSGVHRYLFTLYALDTRLPLSEGATKLDVVNAMNGHVLEQAQLIGTYESKKNK